MSFLTSMKHQRITCVRLSPFSHRTGRSETEWRTACTPHGCLWSDTFCDTQQASVNNSLATSSDQTPTRGPHQSADLLVASGQTVVLMQRRRNCIAGPQEHNPAGAGTLNVSCLRTGRLLAKVRAPRLLQTEGNQAAFRALCSANSRPSAPTTVQLLLTLAIEPQPASSRLLLMLYQFTQWCSESCCSRGCSKLTAINAPLC